MAKTTEIATGFHGDKLYQQRAREVLPILVRQAEARQPIFYEALAQEVGMPNPRNLNYPLGCIGRKLNDLAGEWDDGIPPIEALVVNQHTRFPGPGFNGFLTEQGETWSNERERRALIEQYWARIYAYPYWREVLEELRIKPTPDRVASIVEKAGHTAGGGEGPDHLALKNFICNNPHLVGLNVGDPRGQREYCIPSGDSIDVAFCQKRRVHAVEVKPASSPVTDIARGLFQCVKYRAVLQALAGYEHDRRPVSVCLALGGQLPNELVPLRNSLGIKVFENVRIKSE